MLFWLLVAVAAVIASEAFVRLPVLDRIRRVSALSARAGRVLRSGRISDHWKERILPAYAVRIAGSAILFFGLLCAALLPVLLIGLLYPPGLAAWGAALMRPLAIVVLMALSFAYLWLRVKARSQVTGASDYSGMDRALHRLALASPARAEMLFDIEKAAFLKSAPADSGAHVFVTGLARAGTTILMREIHATGQFGSLTYADMPFVLAPNLWARLSARGRTAGRKAERAHGDGIEVDTQSPEALDEVYWRLFDGGYIGAEGLHPHAPDADTLAGYRDLIRLVLRRTGKGRYVSKNNNTILRISPLAQALPQAQFLVPVREPLAHAASLLNQHERFLNADPFVQDYMTWLGHHEFGATHRPFLFGGRPEGDPMTLDYWLRLWIAAYRTLDEAEARHDNICFVPYEALSSDPAVWQAVARRIGITPRPSSELKVVADKAPGAHDPALAETAGALHARLVARGLRRLGLQP